MKLKLIYLNIVVIKTSTVCHKVSAKVKVRDFTQSHFMGSNFANIQVSEDFIFI